MANKTAVKDQLQDFGQKLGGARKDRVLSAERVISDDQIGNMTLSEIWPKSEVDDIEGIDVAAMATAVRAIIPAKPRQKYKLDRWVETVKLARYLIKYTNEHGFDSTIKLMKERGGLDGFIYRIDLLRQLPREHWSRVEDVEYRPNAHTFDENHKEIPKPYAGARVDGRYVTAPNLEGLVNVVRERLNVEKQQVTMQFEIRGYKDNYSINKKGDPLKRKLKTFTGESAIKEARAYIEQNKANLIKAWEGVKEAENVKETDVRSAENRQRVGKNYRQGRDATPEMFLDAFGFRGVEFGNWVSQGVNTKERQGMLNAAYDALMDLASIMGVSPRWLSLNGALGLGLGSRGSGKASAHYEPGTVVINLTKTRGAGTLAHEWFHAVDNYFQKKRGMAIGDKKSQHSVIDSPGAYYIHKPTLQKVRAARFIELKGQNRVNKPEDWEFVGGLPADLSTSFERLRKALDDSPMAKRSSRIDKGQSGYWSRPHERAARAFENYVIAKMISSGYHNDYLANVVKVEGFKRDPDNYPYLLDDEIEPISKEFDGLFEAIKKHEPKSTEPYEPKVVKKEEAKDVKETGITVIENTRELKVTNLDMLPRGTGAPYLEVIESHIPGEYIAKAVRRKLPDKGSGIFIHMGKPLEKRTIAPEVLEKAREWDKKHPEGITSMPDHKITDVTPAGYGPTDKDEEEYYAEFAEPREGKKGADIKAAKEEARMDPNKLIISKEHLGWGKYKYWITDGVEYYKEFATEKEAEDYLKGIQAPAQAPAAVKAELKESVKEGKQLDKSAAAVVKEAEKIIEQPKEPAIKSQLKVMSYDDRMMYREVVERRIEEVERMAGEMSQEAHAIKEFVDSDPIASYRGKKYGQKVGLIYLLDKGGKFPDTVSRKQAELLLMGRELQPNALDKKGRVRWEYVLDELADHFQMSEQQLIDHVENIADQKSRLSDMQVLISEAADREKELKAIREEIQKYDKITGGPQPEYAKPFIQKPAEEPKVKQEIGQPEAGIQKGMLGEDKEIRPQGKGKVTQINLLEHGRLQEIRAKVAKSDDIHGDIMAEVKKRQEDRSSRSVAADNAQTAKHVVKGEDIKRWLIHPERMDVKGVDTKGSRRLRRTSGPRIRTSR